MSITVKTLKEDAHQINLNDLGLMQVHDIINGVNKLGCSRINEHQITLHEIVQVAIEHKPDLALGYVKTMNLIDQIFVFLVDNQRQAEKLHSELEPINHKILNG